MSDELGDRLAAAIDGGAAPVATTEAMARGKRQARRRAAIAAGVAVVVVVAAGAAIAGATTRKSSNPRVYVGDTTTPTTAKPAPLSAHIDVPSTFLARGSSETVYLVIENNTGADLHLTTAGAVHCYPGWAIVLRNRALPQQALFSTGCSGGALVVGRGETRLPFTLLTTYQRCSSTGYPQGALTPSCVPDAHGGLYRAPPLPPGLYEATFFSEIEHFVPVAPVAVAVFEGSSITEAPTTSTRPIADPAAVLAHYVERHPDVVVHSDPIAYGDSQVAVVGTETNNQNREIVVLSLTAGTATPLATIPLPFPYYDFARELPTQTADVTADGLPDFLVRFEAADNEPGVVVSADGGTWKLVPESSDPSDVYIGRDPTFTAGHLRSSRDDCVPTCAQGHTTTVVWRYDDALRRMVRQ